MICPGQQPSCLRLLPSQRAAGAMVILDPAPAQPLPNDLLAAADFITPNESELRTLLGHTPSEQSLSMNEADAGATALLSRGARNVLVKMGTQGAACWGQHGHFYWPAFNVEAVDTTAAGDAFNAALAAAFAQEMRLADAHLRLCGGGTGRHPYGRTASDADATRSASADKALAL